MTAVADCPKHMHHGPCGGVRDDGCCEVGDLRCAWLGEALNDPPAGPSGGLTDPAAELLALAARRPLVVADLHARPLDADAQRASAAAVAGCLDAALLGDAPWARVQLPPSVRASLVAAEGVRPWSGLNCRDRNRVALEGELAGLAACGAAAVHCVTGDHTDLGDRPDAAPVFDLDSTELAARAATSGLLVSVAESPSTPPRDQRAPRAAAKLRAGARVVFVNHAASTGAVAEFVAATRALAGQDALFIACVPVATSPAGTERLRKFLHGNSPGDALASAEALLAVDGIDGVDLSAAAGPGEELDTARALARLGAALGGGSA